MAGAASCCGRTGSSIEMEEVLKHGPVTTFFVCAADDLHFAGELIDAGDASKGAIVKTYERGYPVGYKAAGEGEATRFFLNNHLRFTILYHEDADAALARIVGFEVEPFSVRHRRSSQRGRTNRVAGQAGRRT